MTSLREFFTAQQLAKLNNGNKIEPLPAFKSMAVRKVKLCKQKNCRNQATTSGYCRVHYLKNWKQIKEKQKKKAIKNLNKYIDHIMHKHPEGYMEVIKEDLRNFDQFSRKAEHYFSEDDFHDIMEELNVDDVHKIIDNIKIDDAY